MDSTVRRFRARNDSDSHVLRLDGQRLLESQCVAGVDEVDIEGVEDAS